MSLINISGNHWKSWARLKRRPLAPKQLGFYQPGVFPISLLVSVVCFGMHRSSLVQESFNYWTKLCHECIWKADAATSCQLALPRQGSKKERKLETEGVHSTWSIWLKSRKYVWILRRQRTWRHLKWKHIFALPLCLWGGGGFGSFHCNNNLSQHWCCESTRQLAGLSACPLFSQRGPRCVHPHTWQTLCQQLWHDSDQERNVPGSGLVNFFTHTLLYWSHSVWHWSSWASQTQCAQAFVCSAGISLCLWAPLWECLAARPPLCGVCAHVICKHSGQL